MDLKRTLQLFAPFFVQGLIITACNDTEVILPGKREPAISGYSKGIENVRNREFPFNVSKAKRNSNWPQGYANLDGEISNFFISAEPKLVWSVDIGTGDVKRNRLSTDPIVYGETIFTLDSKMVLTATSSSGIKKWTKDLTPETETSGQADGGGLAAGDGKLFVSTGYGTLWAFEASTGSVLWQQALLGTGNSQPAYRDDVIYLVSSDATTWSIAADTGRIRWQIDGLADVNNSTGTTGPSISRKLVVFGFGTGEIQAAFRQGGLVLWTASLAGGRSGRSASTIEDVGSTPVISGSRIFAANSTGRIVALNLDSGERIWSAPYGTKSLIWPAGGSVFFVNDLSQLMRLNDRDGSIIWAIDLPDFLKVDRRRSKEVVVHHGPLLAGGQLYVASSDGKMRIFEPRSGKFKVNLDIPGGATTNPVIADGTIYVVSKTGKLHAYR